MKILWYLVGFITILLILINNPKSNIFVNFSDQSQFVSYTRSTQKKLQIATMCSIVTFLLLTAFLIINSPK